MNEWKSLRPVVIMLVVFAVVSVILWAAVATDHARLVIPSPEGTANQFVSALAAHRYAGAQSQLTDSLQEQVSQMDLRDLVEVIEASSLQGIQDSQEQSAQEQGDLASARLKVKFGNNQEQEMEFRLKKEDGLWKVNSINPIRSLVGS